MKSVIAVVRRVPNLGTWLGLLFTAVGFVLITVAWGKTAGEIDVPLQLPYVMSSGFVGLALVCIGATFVAIDARVRESSARLKESRRVADAMDELVRLSEQAR